MSDNPIVNRRYDFVYLFDVTDGNPNGDPDAGNTPRIDIETGHGLVTDVCLKRKVRNYVLYATETKPELQDGRHNIFVMEHSVLNNAIAEAIKEAATNNSVTEIKGKKEKGADDKKEEIASDAQKKLCDKYYDVRTFGAVLSTKAVDGITVDPVRGAVQMTFSRSIDPIDYTDHSITRMAATNENDRNPNQTMGRKATVPYGLYLCHGFVTPSFAFRTGFTQEDLELFWEALGMMFDLDRSAARGLMGPRGLYVFEHSSSLGNARAQDLFDLIKIEKQTDLPRSFADYRVTVDRDRIPEGVTLVQKI